MAINFDKLEIDHLQKQIELLKNKEGCLMEAHNNELIAARMEAYLEGKQDGYAEAKKESKAFIKDLMKEILA